MVQKLPRQTIKRQSRLIQGRRSRPVKRLQRNSPKKAISRILKVSEINNTSIFTACSLAKDIAKWKEITRDPWILKFILGYNIEFESKPFQITVLTPIN
jgi:hypothetical protein